MPTRQVTPKMSVRASQFAQAIQLRDGSSALVRAIRADDRQRLQTAFLALDPESVYLRCSDNPICPLLAGGTRHRQTAYNPRHAHEQPLQE